VARDFWTVPCSIGLWNLFTGLLLSVGIPSNGVSRGNHMLVTCRIKVMMVLASWTGKCTGAAGKDRGKDSQTNDVMDLLSPSRGLIATNRGGGGLAGFFLLLVTTRFMWVR